METRKLYYEDSHLAAFSAGVTSCRQGEKGWEITLSATAFYPEGGGQAGDTGTLGPVRVLDTRERGEEVIHLCDGPLEAGAEVKGVIDYGPRFLRMQQHSGEHIVSGILHRRFGCHNTGFHMGSQLITIDFDCLIPAKVLPEIEAEANRAVWENLPLRVFTPSPEELARTEYRTKRALPWPVRIVEVPGIDRCACCGTHVAFTGEIGLIKLFSAIPFRGGTRMEMACGSAALALLNQAYEQNKLVSQAFSAKIGETGEAARRMNEQLSQQKFKTTQLQRRLFQRIAAGYEGKPLALHFEEDLDGTGLRELAEALAACCGTAAVFSGSEKEGYGYCLADFQQDLRPLNREMTQALRGRGGGKPNFQQGRVQAGRAEIEAFFRIDN